VTKLEPYPEYKDSGAEWLGEVPSKWDVLRIKMSVQTARNGIWGAEPEEEDTGVWCVRVADFDRKSQSVSPANRTMRIITPDELAPRLLSRGDLLLEKSGGGENNPVGFVVRFDHNEPAVCSNFVAKIRLRPGMDSRYWTYVHATTYSVRLTQRSIKQTSGIQNLDQSSYFDEVAPFPPLATQEQIADFLDRETAQIDELIAKQERLIELLDEKRQAVITHAVTLGLDPASPTKPSGSTWLGDIPAHWNVTTVKRLSSVISKGTTPTTLGAEFTDEGIRFLKAENIQNNAVMDMPANYISAETNQLLSRSKLQPDDLLVVIAGATTGKSAVLNMDMTPCNTNQAVAFVRPSDPSMSSWIHHVLTTPRVQSLISSLSVQSAQPNLSMGDLGNIWLPLPPTPEIDLIRTHISRSTARLDELTVSAQRAVDLLRERRTALISAAVTGKINVTNEGVMA
jgi:type I restriction enzyme S subunit